MEHSEGVYCWYFSLRQNISPDKYEGFTEKILA